MRSKSSRPYRGKHLKPTWVLERELRDRQRAKELAGSYHNDSIIPKIGYYDSTPPDVLFDNVVRRRVLQDGDMVSTTPYSVFCHTKKGSTFTGCLVKVQNPWGGYTIRVSRSGSNPDAMVWGGYDANRTAREDLEKSSQVALLDKLRREMRTWDILTDAAELKKTVNSLRDGAQFFARLGTAVRHRDIKRIAQVLGLKTKPQDLRSYHRNIYGIETYEALDRRTPFLVGQGLQNIWMNYRYAVMPVIYSIEDAMISLAGPGVHRDYVFTSQVTLSDTWAASSKTAGLPFNGPYHGLLCDIITSYSTSGSVRKKAYYRFTDSILDRLNPNTLISLAKTAWELVPYSWMVDWGLGFSDYLGRLELSSCLPQVNVNATYKGRSRVTEQLTNLRMNLSAPSTGEFQIISAPGRSVCVADCYTFDRKIGNAAVPGYSPDSVFLNWKRQVDTSAVLWQKVASQSKVRCRIRPR